MNPDYLPPADDLHALLDHLQEECAEVIKACTKIKRFGLFNVYPEPGKTNAEKLLGEIYDVFRAVCRIAPVIAKAERERYRREDNGMRWWRENRG
jgi:hypothetical protein